MIFLFVKLSARFLLNNAESFILIWKIVGGSFWAKVNGMRHIMN